MKADNIRDLDTRELQTQLRDMDGQMFHLRFQMGMGQMEGLKKYRALKKDRARILTVLKERQAAADAEQVGQAVQKG